MQVDIQQLIALGLHDGHGAAFHELRNFGYLVLFDIRQNFKLPVMENVNLITTADFFTPYNKDFGNVDVNWDVLISMKINKVLSATLNMTLKYDNDVKTFNDEGVERGPKVQFKEILGIGLAYNF